RALDEITGAENYDASLAAVKAFDADYGAKWPKAVAKITDELDTLLEYYNYPAQHWKHLRTTNPIESSFATVRLRQRVTKGPGSRAAGIAMAFKLNETAQDRWQAMPRKREGPPRPPPRGPSTRRRPVINGYAVEENPQNPSQSGGEHQ